MPLGKLFTESRSLLVLKRTAVTSVSVLALASVSLTPAALALQTGDSVTYEYDELGRLKQADYSNQATIAYGMDAAGNRTQVSVTGLATADFTVNDPTFDEAQNLVFTVTRTGDLSNPYTIDYDTELTAGTATLNSDYTATSGTLSFAANVASMEVTVPVLEDTTLEAGETVMLDLANASGGATISDAPGMGTIADNDSPPAFSIADASVSEGGDLVFTVTKTGTTPNTYSVDFATAHGMAGAGDYTTNSGTLTFLPAENTKQITVTTTDDVIEELSETLTLTLSNPTGGATFSNNDSDAIGTIIDNEGAPAFSISDTSATEGTGATFTVTKSGSTALTYTVDYATASGTATTADYPVTSGTLTFAPGEATKTVTPLTTEDTLDEADELFYLNLSNASGSATITDTQGVATIVDDDAEPSFSINNVSATEGNNLNFTVTKSGSTSLSFSVNYATANGSAGAGDYTAKSGTLTFAAGETTKTVTIATTGDTTDEANETLNLNLSGATGGSTISDGQGVGTINDNDAGPAFSVNDVSVTEGGNLTFTVTKSGTTTQSYSVNYATANGSAETGDYTAKSGTLTFGASETSKTVSVPTAGDTTDEANETVNLNLSGASAGSSISDSQGVGTINNNDATPSFSINDVSATEGGNLTFTVTTSGATERSFDVTYDAQNGSATAADYTDTSGTLNFGSGTTTKTVSVATVNDSIDENAQTVNLKLTGVNNGGTFTDDTGVGTINDNDAAPSFQINNQTITEGATATMTVTRVGATEKTYTVDYSTRNSSASAGSDYTAASGTLSFSPGQGTRTFNVTTIQDGLDEAQERIWLDLTNASGGATFSDNLGQAKINDDDESPVAVDDSTSMSMGQYKNLDVRLNDSDGDGDSLTVTSVTQPGNASVIIQSSNVLRIIAGSSGTATFTYTVTDGNGNYDTGTVTVTVTGGGGGGPPLF